MKITDARPQAFLAALRVNGGNVTRACRSASPESRAPRPRLKSFQRLAKADPEFAMQWALAARGLVPALTPPERETVATVLIHPLTADPTLSANDVKCRVEAEAVAAGETTRSPQALDARDPASPVVRTNAAPPPPLPAGTEYRRASSDIAPPSPPRVLPTPTYHGNPDRGRFGDPDYQRTARLMKGRIVRC